MVPLLRELRRSPVPAVLVGLLALCQALSGVVFVVAAGVVVDAGDDPRRALGGVGWLTAAAAVGVISQFLSAESSRTLQDRHHQRVASVLLDRRLQAGRPLGEQTLDSSRDGLGADGYAGLTALLGAVLAGAASTVMVAAWQPVAAIVCVLLWLLVGRLISSWLASTYALDATEDRSLTERANYLRSVMSGFATAAEVRLFGAADWFLHQFVALQRDVQVHTAAHRRGPFRRVLGGLAGVVLAYLGIFIWLGTDLQDSAVSAGRFVIIIQSLIGIAGIASMGDHTVSVHRLIQENRALELLAAQSAARATPADDNPREVVPATDHVVLDNVAYAYPGGTYAVRDVSLSIRAGSLVAIVGHNGAGKTTLASLIARTLVPDEGTVSSPPAAVMLQSFVRYPLSLADNISLGSPDPRRLAEVEADVMLSEDIVGSTRRLASGYRDGRSLSGGQWQKVALARALYAAGHSGVLVLDEPASALDVRAEAEFFGIVRSIHGPTRVFITHRLGGIEAADRILVMDHGRIIADGNHADLLASHAQYRSMYTSQRARADGAAS